MIAAQPWEGIVLFRMIGPAAAAVALMAMPAEAGSRLSTGDEFRLVQSVRSCIQVPAGKSAVVTLQIMAIEPDGRALSQRIKIQDNAGDPGWATTVLQAFADPACQPWAKPRAGWPTEPFTILVDPKDLS